MAQLLAQAVIQRRRLTTKSRQQLLIGFLCYNSEHVPHRIQAPSQLKFHPPYHQKYVIDLVSHKNAITSQCSNSPKLSRFHNNTPKGYFAPKTEDFKNFTRPILPKCDRKYQLYTNTVTQHQNTIDLSK